VFYFHNLFLLEEDIVAELMDQLCDLLRDPKVSFYRPPSPSRVLMQRLAG
jgi:hypothetical protein